MEDRYLLLAIVLSCSILLLLLEMLGFASAVQYPIDLGKFTYVKQRIVLSIFNIFCTVCILITYLLQPTAELVFVVLLSGQLVLGSIYMSILNILCKKRFLYNIVNELQKLNLNINENMILLRRQLMENSDLFCSIKELKQAVELVKRNDKY